MNCGGAVWCSYPWEVGEERRPRLAAELEVRAVRILAVLDGDGPAGGAGDRYAVPGVRVAGRRVVGAFELSEHERKTSWM